VLPQPQHVAKVEAAIHELTQSAWVKQEHTLVHEAVASAAAAAGGLLSGARSLSVFAGFTLNLTPGRL
jgi:hypothetical protein